MRRIRLATIAYCTASVLVGSALVVESLRRALDGWVGVAAIAQGVRVVAAIVLVVLVGLVLAEMSAYGRVARGQQEWFLVIHQAGTALHSFGTKMRSPPEAASAVLESDPLPGCDPERNPHPEGRRKQHNSDEQAIVDVRPGP